MDLLIHSPTAESELPVFYIDGQSIGNERKGQPREARIAIAYREGPDANFELHWQKVGDRTNNEAEYYALLKALSIIYSKWAEPNHGTIPRSFGPVKIYSDSELIVKQVNGEYEVRDPKLLDLWRKAMALKERMGAVSLEWIPREENYAGQWLERRWKGGKVEVVQEKS